MKNYLLLAVLLIPFLNCCRKAVQTDENDLIPASVNPISVSGTRFIDSYGRQVIFNGINRVNKDQKMNYVKDSAGSYEQLGRWGFNIVRLGIIWDGVEPEPGKFDESYLDKVVEIVEQASRNGIHILLDMHQDLYSVAYSDGAPLWATLTDDKPHIQGSIWSDAYFMSPAVQKAFDNFWTNKQAPDGTGLQDHYASMWQQIAKRFANNPAVIGYDIMNEPFNGSQGNYILPLILTEYARMYAEETGTTLSQDEVMNIWADEDSRFEALSGMQDAWKYSRVLDVATEICQQFEKETLQPMYQKISNAIRKVDTTHILFLEHSYFGNTGIRSGIEPVKGRNGMTDPLVAYAAHGYDLLVDTRNYDSQSHSRVELIFSRIRETSERMNVPVLVGEWGALSGNSVAAATNAYAILKIFERYLFSETYWAYYPGIEKNLYFNAALIRPYPRYTGGRLRNYSYDQGTGIFTCSWEEIPEVKAPTVVYLPIVDNLMKESLKLNPERSNTVIQHAKGSQSGHLVIPVTGKSMVRTISFRIKKSQEPFSIIE